jgi:hypothetical protein
VIWIVANIRDFGVRDTVGWVIVLEFGPVFLTWLYQSGACSILIVAQWHTVYNFTTATKAGSGVAAVLATTAVIFSSVVILRQPATWISPAGGPPAERP